jgi:hypothetical protein
MKYNDASSLILKILRNLSLEWTYRSRVGTEVLNILFETVLRRQHLKEEL